MNTRISYKFVLKAEANSRGLYPVYMRAFLHGKKIEIATSITIVEGDWSETKQRVKRRNKLNEKHNMILEAFEKKALKCILDNFVYEETPLTLRQFKDYMLSIGQTENSFTDYILNYLNENKSRLRSESWWSYKSQITKLLKFRKHISFADLTEKFINEYQHYMLYTLHNNENTVSKSLRSLRTFINIAMRYGLIKTNPFKYFLFSCYTGLRYSDLKMLKTSSIKNNILHINMHKTNCLVSIPLSQKALQLLPNKINSESDYVFRVYCNKVTNRVLKQVGKRYGIPKKLTCHVARHTFATVSIILGIPIEVVSKLLGHSSLKTTQIYAKIVDSVKEREMEKWDKL